MGDYPLRPPFLTPSGAYSHTQLIHGGGDIEDALRFSPARARPYSAEMRPKSTGAPPPPTRPPNRALPTAEGRGGVGGWVGGGGQKMGRPKSKIDLQRFRARLFGWLARSPAISANSPEEEAPPPLRISIDPDKFPQIDPVRRGAAGFGATWGQRRAINTLGESVGDISGASIFASNDTAAGAPLPAQIPNNTINPPA